MANYSLICRDDTFGPGVPAIASCRGGFDFTITFEEIIFCIGPSCLLLFLVPWRLYHLWTQPRKTATDSSWGLACKIIGFIALAILQNALLALSSATQVEYRSTLIASAVLQLLSVLLLTALSFWEHRNAVRPSFLITAFLLPSCILDAARARSHALIPTQNGVAAVLITIVVIKVLLLVLENGSYNHNLLPDYSKKSSELRSGLFSRALFLWLLPLLSMGYKGVLTPENLPTVNEELCSQQLSIKVASRWRKDQSKGRNSLMFSTLFSFPKELVVVLLASAVQVGLQVCQPFLIQDLITFLGSPLTSNNIGYGLLGGFLCVSILNALVTPWFFHYSCRLMIKARGALISIIYARLLQLEGDSPSRMTAFTLITTDVEKIVDNWWRILESGASVFQIGIGTYLLYQQLGAVCCAPLLVILFTFTLVGIVGSKVPKYQDIWFRAVENRLKSTAHVISSLRSVKLLGLAEKMETTIQDQREQEIEISQKFRIYNCIALTFAYAPQSLAPLITFGAYAISRLVSKQPGFSAAGAITSLSIINLISNPAMQILLAVPMGAQAIGSFARIQAFLQHSEFSGQNLESLSIFSTSATVRNSDDFVHPEQNGLEQYPLLRTPTILEDVHDAVPSLPDLDFESFSLPLMSFLGRIPSSRSQLSRLSRGLSSLAASNETLSRRPVYRKRLPRRPVDIKSLSFQMNSIIAITGPTGCGKSTLLRNLISSCRPDSQVAYCSQTPWIYDGTVFENIVGDSNFQAAWYHRILRCCELDTDISRMPEGDGTHVGSGGSLLSGGQKQRIAIARALYANKKRVIFDDVTSALDGRTSSALVSNLFGRGGIFSRGTAVIIATHSKQILKVADKILLMSEDCTIVDSGSYSEIAARNPTLIQDEEEGNKPSEPLLEDVAKVTSSELETRREAYESGVQLLADDLKRQKGDWRSYKYYLASQGWFNFALAILGSVFFVVFSAYFGVWLTKWSEDVKGRHGLGYWLGLYATWAGLILLTMLITPIFYFVKLASRASVIMHRKLLASTMRAPLSILSGGEDVGSLINRFSQDIRLLDWQLPLNIYLTLLSLLTCLASLGIAISAVSYIAAGIPLLIGVLYLLQMVYLRTSRQLRLLEIESKAPVASLFLDTIQGITTIHAFDWVDSYTWKNFALVDASQEPYYLLFCVQRWLNVVLALIVAGIELVVVGMAIGLRSKVNAGLVGLAVVQVSSLARGLSDLVMQWTEMETSLGAVSRIYKFTHNTPREDGETENLAEPPSTWPSAGGIKFEGVSATYSVQGNPGSLALKNLSFEIYPGQKIGICGRTGSGKSSLVATLMRILPCCQGQISIDDIEISTMQPNFIRSKLNYVTQEPFLLEGTIRDNLKPWNDQVEDDQMMAALATVELWPRVLSRGGLDTILEEKSLSQGEKQLLCLARALLRDRSILILDEPTGNIDPVTDVTIQRVIREGFTGRTVIMIAHRLQSLMDFDQVMVLESGSLVEMGRPGDLVLNPYSKFGILCRAGRKRVSKARTTIPCV